MSKLKSVFSRIRGSETVTSPQATPAPEPLLISAYSTLTSLILPDFSHQLAGQRDLSDPGMAKQLDGFQRYVMSRGDGKMTATRYHLWRHIQRTKYELTFSMLPSDLPRLTAWALRANSVQFLPDGSVRDPAGAVLIDSEGRSDAQTHLPYPEDAIARKQKTLERLDAAAIKVPIHIPPVLGEGEVRLRPALEVIQRAMALILVAVQAEGWKVYQASIKNQLHERFPQGFSFLTLPEQAFLESTEPEPQTIANMGWRYEALQLLLWSLGLYEALPGVESIADAAALASTMEQIHKTPAMLQDLRLRPAAEILDELDFCYRMHWITRQANIKGTPMDSYTSSIVSERHFALNWLTGFENPPDTEWDKTDTPT